MYHVSLLPSFPSSMSESQIWAVAENRIIINQSSIGFQGYTSARVKGYADCNVGVSWTNASNLRLNWSKVCAIVVWRFVRAEEGLRNTGEMCMTCRRVRWVGCVLLSSARIYLGVRIQYMMVLGAMAAKGKARNGELLAMTAHGPISHVKNGRWSAAAAITSRTLRARALQERDGLGLLQEAAVDSIRGLSVDCLTV